MVSARGATWCPFYRTLGQVVDDIRVTAKGCGRDNHSLTLLRGNWAAGLAAANQLTEFHLRPEIAVLARSFGPLISRLFSASGRRRLIPASSTTVGFCYGTVQQQCAV